MQNEYRNLTDEELLDKAAEALAQILVALVDEQQIIGNENKENDEKDR